MHQFKEERQWWQNVMSSGKNYNSNIIILIYSHSLPGVLEKEKKYTNLYLGPYWMGRRGGRMLRDQEIRNWNNIWCRKSLTALTSKQEAAKHNSVFPWFFFVLLTTMLSYEYNRHQWWNMYFFQSTSIMFP